MLVSIHIPKTAGTAFRQLLEHRYGERLYLDYADRPLSHCAAYRLAKACAAAPLQRRRTRGVEAVHGHFLALKYSLTDGPFVTWLRDPVQRVISRYEHYCRDVSEGRPLQRVRGLRPGLTLEEFVEIPRFQNTACKYLSGFPWSRIDCYGFSEDVSEGLARMRRRVGLELGAEVSANSNPRRPAGGYRVPPRLRARITTLNSADVRLWHYAREREGW